MGSMAESMKICISLSNGKVREAGTESRLKKQGKSESFDNEQTWITIKGYESEEKLLMSGTTEKGNARRKQPLAKQ